MTVERLAKEHLSEVAALEALVFPEPWSPASLELLLGDGAFGFVATEEGRVLSYAGLLCAAGEGEILNVATHPDARGRGYATAVLCALLAEARARALSPISLEVRASNAGAIRLYEKAGFLTAGRRRDFYRFPREDALVMVLK